MFKTIITTALNVVCTAGAHQVIDNAVKVLTPDNLKKSEKILTWIGGAVLSTVAGCAIGSYIEKEVDSAFEFKDRFFKKDNNKDTIDVQIEEDILETVEISNS